MFKKTREYVQKNREDVHETSPKIGSTKTCKKHGKICTQHGQCLPWCAPANIPVFGSWYPHVWKLTCPRLPTNVSMFFTTSRSLWCSSTFLFPKCWCPAKRLQFLETSQKTRVSYSDCFVTCHYARYDNKVCSNMQDIIINATHTTLQKNVYLDYCFWQRPSRVEHGM
jgi:hypothetical protein